VHHGKYTYFTFTALYWRALPAPVVVAGGCSCCWTQLAGGRCRAPRAAGRLLQSGEAAARRTGPAGRCSVESAGGRWQGGQAGAQIRLEQRNERAGAQMRVGGEGLEGEKRRVSG